MLVTALALHFACPHLLSYDVKVRTCVHVHVATRNIQCMVLH